MCVSGVCIYIYVDGWKSRDRRVGVRGGGGLLRVPCVLRCLDFNLGRLGREGRVRRPSLVFGCHGVFIFP